METTSDVFSCASVPHSPLLQRVVPSGPWGFLLAESLWFDPHSQVALSLLSDTQDHQGSEKGCWLLSGSLFLTLEMD